ncbi:hypothetical protein [Peribacillus simplex]|uniref:hypothetical protein n=1 Tax=Peribacillus simplex TaxID=1478 RepID=UPI003D2BF313
MVPRIEKISPPAQFTMVPFKMIAPVVEAKMTMSAISSAVAEMFGPVGAPVI